MVQCREASTCVDLPEIRECLLKKGLHACMQELHGCEGF